MYFPLAFADLQTITVLQEVLMKTRLTKKHKQNMGRYIQRIPKSFVAKYKIHICIFYAVVDIFMLRTCVKRNGSPSF